MTPNLPQHRVRVAAVSEDDCDVIASLRQEGIEVVKVRAVPTLPAPVASHSDLQLLHLGGCEILLAKEAKYLNSPFTKLGFRTAYLCTELGTEYPNDISLNFLILKNSCFCLLSNIPLQVEKYCNHAGLQLVNSKQGYVRCSVAMVTPNAAITADYTLYKLLTAVQIDVLLIEPGDILLPGYDTGFIGGCCGLIDSSRLAFTGNLNYYKNGIAVQAFLKKHQVTPVYLTDGKLLDIGGILPLAEE